MTYSRNQRRKKLRKIGYQNKQKKRKGNSLIGRKWRSHSLKNLSRRKKKEDKAITPKR